MFEDKLRERYEVNRKAMNTALNTFREMFDTSGAVFASDASLSAVFSILRYFNISDDVVEEWNAGTDVCELLSAQGLFVHKVNLEGKWWLDATGPMLCTGKNGELVSLLPTSFGYKRLMPDTGEWKKVSSKSVADLPEEALNFFYGLENEKLSVKDLVKYALKCVPAKDYFIVFLCCVTATLLSLLVPVANKLIFSEIVPSGLVSGILPICALLLGAGISSAIFTMVRNFIVARTRDKINACVQPALFARLLSLPSSFFRTRSSSDLGSRVLAANNIYTLLTGQLMSVLSASIFIALYIIIAFMYAKSMVLLITLLIIGYFVVYWVLIKNYSKEFSEKISNNVSAQQFAHGTISGIHKIKNNRAEYRAYSQWAQRYAKSEEITAKTSAVLRYRKVVGSAVYSFGTFFVWVVAWKSNMVLSDLMAFMSAFGVMQNTLFIMTTHLQSIAQVMPYARLLTPILETRPERKIGMTPVQNISGSIDINHVTFSYNNDSRKILDDVNLHISPGENVGIVGSSGCGKSTLMRIMLGFEKPSSGSVFYGQYNLENVNMGSLRQYIGYCPQAMQVFPGTIADNIRLAAPLASDEEIWGALSIASLADDVRRMPLQLQTMVGENGSGMSGGQCQRLLIARAVINSPKVLFFDEATAALDNITQRKVMENLDMFKCTRVAIAHRLSTVANCDRIIVLDRGKVVEDGSPADLMKNKGFFYRLSIRQQ